MGSEMLKTLVATTLSLLRDCGHAYSKLFNRGHIYFHGYIHVSKITEL